MMTVRDLRAALVGADDDSLVVMAADEEGNEFLRLHQVEKCQYDETTSEVSGEHLPSANAALKPAILLWPARP